MKKYYLLIIIIFSTISWGQSYNFKGKVIDKNGTPIPGANIEILDKNILVITDVDGYFYLQINHFPVKIKVDYTGYENKIVEITNNKPIEVILVESEIILDETVITATRQHEKIQESNVSIDVLHTDEILNSPATDFYTSLERLSGVQDNVSSYNFHSINTRGFAAFYNRRFVQLIDGNDNSSPILNFPLGNVMGIGELDVERVEVISGPTSSVYGANAFNGMLNIITKNPFEYKGVSSYINYGITHQDFSGTNPYYDAGFRYATGNDKIAGKINFSFYKGTNWTAYDITDMDNNPLNQNIKGSRESNPSFDGLNVYGDEIATTLPVNSLSGGLLDDIRVSRTGYNETDLVDDELNDIRANIALHYRPTGKKNDWEIIAKSSFTTGKTIYQGTNRYHLDNFLMQQHGLEIKNKNFYTKAYYSLEQGGNSYDIRLTGWNLNRKWRSDKDWFSDYAAIYTSARLGLLPGQTQPMNEADAHRAARDFADNSPVDYQNNPKTPRLIPGTEAYQKALNEVISDENLTTGSKFVDLSNLKHFEANYNFNDLIKFAQIQIGGSYRIYSLGSKGRIFTDYENLPDINIDEMGGYVQIIKYLFDKHIKLTNSIRYDKQMDFEGHISPQISMVASLDKKRNNFLRFAYKTGFRNPTTQDLYMGLDLGYFTILGSAPDNPDRYKETITDRNGNQVTLTGTDAVNNSYTLTSVQKFIATGDPAKLKKANFETIRPEKVSTIETGFRSKINKKLYLDISGFYNKYNDFIKYSSVVAIASQVGNVNDNSGIAALANKDSKPFYIYQNEKKEIEAAGGNLKLEYRHKKMSFQLMYDYMTLLNSDDVINDKYEYHFNTPEHRIKFSWSHDAIWKGLGLRIDYKYQTEFEWGSSFGNGLVPEQNIINMQLMYRFNKPKIQIKISANNLLGKEYIAAPGAGMIGSIYYIKINYGF